MQFDLLLVDCPWGYNSRAVHSNTRFGGGATGQYPVLTDEDLFGLKEQIHRICAPDCLLLLWAVNPKMDSAVDLVRAWEFKWGTSVFSWVKRYANGKFFRGPGSYTASNHEVCVAAYRGEYQAPMEKLADGTIYEEILDPVIIEPHPRYASEHSDPDKRNKIIHSAKPEEVRNRIDRLWPNQSKLELFARSLRPRWTAIGLDLTGNDIRVDLDMLAQDQIPDIQGVNPGCNPQVDELWKAHDSLGAIQALGVSPGRVSVPFETKRDRFLAQLRQEH